MYPLEFFVPKHTNYLVAIKYLKAAELALHEIQKNSPPAFYEQDSRLEEEFVKLRNQIDFTSEDIEIFRKGMQFAAICISHQFLTDLSENGKQYFQSIGQLELAQNEIDRAGHMIDSKCFMQDDPEVDYEQNVMTSRLQSALLKIKEAKSTIKKSYPFQTIIDSSTDA